jgi:hypothetical protein
MDQIVKEAIEIYLHANNCKQGSWLHIKLHMATGNQFTEMLCTARNNKPRPSAVTF